jgi:hypothetical protein
MLIVVAIVGPTGFAPAATPDVFKAHSYCQPVVGHGEGKTYKIAVERAIKDCEGKGGKTADCEKNAGPD